MRSYKNRREAGQLLATHLLAFANQDAVVLGLPRGGVPVAFEVAKALHAPLDVFIVRKLGVPGHSELAIGAIATGGVNVLNHDIIDNLGISNADINAVAAQEQKELQRREKVYRGSNDFSAIKNKVIILVDDGIATGASLQAAILALRQLHPKKIIVAVPVADQSMREKFLPLVDAFICPLQPAQLFAVGNWYDDFSQTEDEEVYTLLKEAKKYHDSNQ